MIVSNVLVQALEIRGKRFERNYLSMFLLRHSRYRNGLKTHIGADIQENGSFIHQRDEEANFYAVVVTGVKRARLGQGTRVHDHAVTEFHRRDGDRIAIQFEKKAVEQFGRLADALDVRQQSSGGGNNIAAGGNHASIYAISV